MSRKELIAIAVAGGAIVAVLVVGIGLGWLNGEPSGAAPAKRLAVTSSLAPQPAFYGDELTAEVAVEIDRSAVSADSVRVTPNFTPYIQTARPTISRTRVGNLETLRYRYSIQCVSDQCLLTKGKAPYVLQLKPTKVTAMAGTEQLTAPLTWPRTFVASRLTAKDIAATQFRWAKTAPEPTYSVSPGRLAGLLTIVAGLLAVVAIALIGFEVVRLIERRRQRAQVVLTPLEAALLYTRDAAGRPDPADRRKALGLLAKTLDEEGVTALAGTAGDVAWSEAPPTPDRAIELADEVESAAKAGR